MPLTNIKKEIPDSERPEELQLVHQTQLVHHILADNQHATIQDGPEKNNRSPS